MTPAKARQRQRADVSKTKPQRKRAGADVPIRVRKGIITIPAQHSCVGGVVQAAAALLSPTTAYKTAVKVDSAFARFWWILRGGLAHYHLDKSLRPPLESPQNHRKILESFAGFYQKKILRFAVLLVVFFVDFLKKPASAAPCTAVACFGAELDLRSAVALKSTKSLL